MINLNPESIKRIEKVSNVVVDSKLRVYDQNSFIGRIWLIVNKFFRPDLFEESAVRESLIDYAPVIVEASSYSFEGRFLEVHEFVDEKARNTIIGLLRKYNASEKTIAELCPFAKANSEAAAADDVESAQSPSPRAVRAVEEKTITKKDESITINAVGSAVNWKNKEDSKLEVKVLAPPTYAPKYAPKKLPANYSVLSQEEKWEVLKQYKLPCDFDILTIEEQNDLLAMNRKL